MGDTTTDMFDLCRLVRERIVSAGMTVRSIAWRLGEVRAVFANHAAEEWTVWFDDDLGEALSANWDAVSAVLDEEISRARRLSIPVPP